MAYGQHQSFYLRDRWLNKAVKNLLRDERFFYDEEAFEKIGLGKNMLKSLRYWVVATGIIEEKYNEERKKVHVLTPLGKLIYKYDKFIQFNDTSSILHYNLTKDIKVATSWYWFFNIYSKNSVTKEELHLDLVDWVKAHEDKVISDRSLKRDIDCLVKLYTAGHSVVDPEEVIQSPLNKLGLLKENKGIVFKNSPSIDDISEAALYYILISYSETYNLDNISVEEITSNKYLWGKIFNFNRPKIVEVLERLSSHPIYAIKFTRTNNIDTVRIPDVASLDFLEFEYKRKAETLV